MSTHNRGVLQGNLGEGLASKLWDRFEIHQTRAHASWLNQAEIAVGMNKKRQASRLEKARRSMGISVVIQHAENFSDEVPASAEAHRSLCRAGFKDRILVRRGGA